MSKSGGAKLLILISTALITCFGTLRISSSQQEQQPETRVRITSDLVVLSVSVRDRAGNLVPGLRREQFQLFDDGVEQEIKVFAEESLPLSIVILVDNDVNGRVRAANLPSVSLVVMTRFSSVWRAKSLLWIFFPAPSNSSERDVFPESL